MKYLIHSNGEELGPLSIREVQQGVAHGVFQDSDFVWGQGMDGWKPAREILLMLGLSPLPNPIPRVRIAAPVHRSRCGPLAGKCFLITKRGHHQSNCEYDLINVDAGRSAIRFRKDSMKGIPKESWPRLDVCMMDPRGAVHIVLKGNSTPGATSAHAQTGEKVGEIRRTSVLPKLVLEVFEEERPLLHIRSSGLGQFSSEHQIRDDKGHQLGTVSDCTQEEAERMLREQIWWIDPARLLPSGCSFPTKIELHEAISTKQKMFLFAASYHLSVSLRA